MAVEERLMSRQTDRQCRMLRTREGRDRGRRGKEKCPFISKNGRLHRHGGHFFFNIIISFFFFFFCWSLLLHTILVMLSSSSSSPSRDSLSVYPGLGSRWSTDSAGSILPTLLSSSSVPRFGGILFCYI